jgi:putative ABC transport system permease protein
LFFGAAEAPGPLTNPMTNNTLRVAWRHFRKHKSTSLLNIFGLTVGICCCLLLFAYVAFERSYDSFNHNADRIFRVQLDYYQNGRLDLQSATNSPGVAPALQRDFPEVERTGRLFKADLILANTARDLKFHETHTFYADASILQLFQIPLTAGDPGTALQTPGKIVLSQDMARKYFGKENPIGKVLTALDASHKSQLEVSGVFANYPANAHLHPESLISYPTLDAQMGDGLAETDWYWPDFDVYMELRRPDDRARVEARLEAFTDRYVNNLPQNKATNTRNSFFLMPLKDIHLHSHYSEEAEPNGDAGSVSFLLLIAFFIIGIAWINYVNLATARSLERAREVGVRKVLGAVRSQLIRQFLTESLILNSIAGVLTLVLAWALTPLFAQLTGKALPTPLSLPKNYALGFLLLFIAGALLSGAYPAFVLSRYDPVTVLKGWFKQQAGGILLRKGLITGQFVASILLIAGTLIVYHQVSYMRSQQLGVNINETLVLDAPGSLPDSAYRGSLQPFKTELLKIPGINSVTASSNVMGQEIHWATDWHQWRLPHQSVNLFHLGVDDEFIRDYGLTILAGRSFAKSFGGTDRHAVVLNQSAIKALGFDSPQAALGEWLHGNQGKAMDSVKIIGVVADFHHEGLQKTIQPLVLLPRPGVRGSFSIKMAAAEMPERIARLKAIWQRWFPADPFSYFFLDEFFDRQYAEEQRFGVLFGLFAGLAILLACFGLFGLSAYTIAQRTKEIRVRKILGASVRDLILLLSKDFLSLVALALIIAVPLTWMLMHRWLQTFAYRDAIQWWVFVVAGALAFFIALATVMTQAAKAAGSPYTPCASGI